MISAFAEGLQLVSDWRQECRTKSRLL